MDWSNVIVGAMALVGTLVGAYAANRKSSTLIAYRLEELENKVNKHNKVIERTFALEKRVEVDEEKLKVANNKIADLEQYHK